MYNITKKNYTTLDEVFDSFFNNAVFTPPAVKYQNSRLSIDVTEEEAVIALSVLGHSKDDITIELEEDAIFVKSIKRELSKVENELIQTINDRISVGDKFDGEKTSAKITNGILYLTIPKKEELKPKKVTIKVG
jgi:HSP20 family molecular chaperone IbpA